MPVSHRILAGEIHKALRLIQQQHPEIEAQFRSDYDLGCPLADVIGWDLVGGVNKIGHEVLTRTHLAAAEVWAYVQDHTDAELAEMTSQRIIQEATRGDEHTDADLNDPPPPGRMFKVGDLAQVNWS